MGMFFGVVAGGAGVVVLHFCGYDEDDRLFNKAFLEVEEALRQNAQAATETIGLLPAPVERALAQKLDTTRLVDRLIDLASDADSGVRAQALLALSKYESHSSYTAPVLIAGTKSPEAVVRGNALLALSRARPVTADAEAALLQGLKDENVRVRETTARVLGPVVMLLANPEPALRAALADPSPSVRELAGAALKRFVGKNGK